MTCQSACREAGDAGGVMSGVVVSPTTISAQSLLASGAANDLDVPPEMSLPLVVAPVRG